MQLKKERTWRRRGRRRRRQLGRRRGSGRWWSRSTPGLPRCTWPELHESAAGPTCNQPKNSPKTHAARQGCGGRTGGTVLELDSMRVVTRRRMQARLHACCNSGAASINGPLVQTRRDAARLSVRRRQHAACVHVKRPPGQEVKLCRAESTQRGAAVLGDPARPAAQNGTHLVYLGDRFGPLRHWLTLPCGP